MGYGFIGDEDGFGGNKKKDGRRKRTVKDKREKSERIIIRTESRCVYKDMDNKRTNGQHKHLQQHLPAGR